MVLTEKEKEVLGYLRNPLYRSYKIMQGDNSPVNDLLDEELLSLYNKMDEIIEDEGNARRGVGSLDEMYIAELAGVKDKLLKELTNRGICLVKEEKKMPTIDDFCQALEKVGETELSEEIKCAAMYSRLTNPLLDVSLPEEMHDKIAICRTPGISQYIVFDSIEEIKDIIEEK